MMRPILATNVDSTKAVRATTPLPRLHWFHWLLIALNEIHKGLLLIWSYKIGWLTQIFFYAFLFFGFSFFRGNGNMDAQTMAPALLGYVTWYYLRQITISMSGSLREEAQTGTLEQMYMSPAPTGLIQMGRSLSPLLISTAFMSIIGGLLMVLFRIHIPFHWSGIPIFLLTMVGVYGFAFIVGGATLLFKHIGNLLFLIQFMLLFLNGAFVPLDEMPLWLGTVARTMPTTQGVLMLQQVLLEGKPLGATWEDGNLAWLLIHSMLYFALGWIVFSFCQQKAKQKGILGHY